MILFKLYDLSAQLINQLYLLFDYLLLLFYVGLQVGDLLPEGKYLLVELGLGLLTLQPGLLVQLLFLDLLALQPQYSALVAPDLLLECFLVRFLDVGHVLFVLSTEFLYAFAMDLIQPGYILFTLFT